MPAKKQQINPFSVYMIEQEAVLRRQGISFKEKKELVDYLYPHFKALTVDQQNIYKVKAKQKREIQKNDLTQKFDGRGLSLQSIVDEDEAQKKKIQKQVFMINEIVIDTDLLSCLSQTYCTLCVSIFCQTDEGVNSIFIPCEFSVVRWSLSGGVTNCCHFVVKPSDIPSGYKSVCLDVSNETHRIPLNYPKAESGYAALWSRLMDFLKHPDLDQQLPVFTLRDSMNSTEGCLKWLHARCLHPSKQKLPQLLPMERLLYTIFERANREQPESHCDDLLRSELDQYATQLACQYHADQDNSLHCMRAKAIRLTYTLLHICAPLFDLELSPGTHKLHDSEDYYEIEESVTFGVNIKPWKFREAKDTQPNFPDQYERIQPNVRSTLKDCGPFGQLDEYSEESAISDPQAAPAKCSSVQSLGRGRGVGSDVESLGTDRGVWSDVPSIGRGRGVGSVVQSLGRGRSVCSDVQSLGRGRSVCSDVESLGTDRGVCSDVQSLGRGRSVCSDSNELISLGRGSSLCSDSNELISLGRGSRSRSTAASNNQGSSISSRRPFHKDAHL